MRVQAPFVVWMALVLTVYAVSYTTLGRSSEGLINNSIADNVLFRISRVVFFAIKYGLTHCSVAFLIPFPFDALPFCRFCSRETTIDKVIDLLCSMGIDDAVDL
jgi:hypothetical protein